MSINRMTRLQFVNYVIIPLYTQLDRKLSYESIHSACSDSGLPHVARGIAVELFINDITIKNMEIKRLREYLKTLETDGFVEFV